MTFQVCDVNGPLVSVRTMCTQGNRVVFDEDGSYIEQKDNGVGTKIRDVWRIICSEKQSVQKVGKGKWWDMGAVRGACSFFE